MRKLIKINPTGEVPVECFHSLKTFFEKYTEYLPEKRSIELFLLGKRKKPLPYEFKLYRAKVE